MLQSACRIIKRGILNHPPPHLSDAVIGGLCNFCRFPNQKIQQSSTLDAVISQVCGGLNATICTINRVLSPSMMIRFLQCLRMSPFGAAMTFAFRCDRTTLCINYFIQANIQCLAVIGALTKISFYNDQSIFKLKKITSKQKSQNLNSGFCHVSWIITGICHTLPTFILLSLSPTCPHLCLQTMTLFLSKLFLILWERVQSQEVEKHNKLYSKKKNSTRETLYVLAHCQCVNVEVSE